MGGSGGTYCKVGVFGGAVQTLNLVVLVDDRDTFGIVSGNNATDTANRGSLSRLNGHGKLLEVRAVNVLEIGGDGRKKKTAAQAGIGAIYSSKACCGNS
jgi:hypothetical protein